MKYFACFLSCFLSVISIAQSELTNATVDITINETRVEVQQNLQFNIPDTVQKITLRGLEFAGTNLVLNGISSVGKALDFNQSQGKGITSVTITTNEQPFKTLVLNYTIIPAKANFYLPLFFTDLPAANSDNDFFKASLKLPKNQNLLLHFPKVELAESETANEHLINLEVPALPSLFRLELLPKEATGMQFATMVDWLVAFLFVIIGIIIWNKRNLLKYG